MKDREIICIEEPELHLHPLLQKKLMRYLRDKTQNQYFIATHSPSFIDTPDAAIFRVRYEDGKTKIKESVLRSDLYAICDDLGHKASELAQANAVIWVEGPSDRIYLKHWLSSLAPHLIEGVHYSLMFYGGRLLSHLTIEEQEIKRFIDLRALNRHVAILIDSDRKKPAEKLNQTKQRVVEEFRKGNSAAWVTNGREIENYVDSNVLQAALKILYSDIYGFPADNNKYSHALHFYKKSARPPRANSKAAAKLLFTSVDKVRVARELTKGQLSLDVLDLRKRLKELVQMISDANGLPDT